MTLKPMQIGLITGFGGLLVLGAVVYGMKQHAPGYLKRKEVAEEEKSKLRQFVKEKKDTNQQLEEDLQQFIVQQEEELQQFILQNQSKEDEIQKFKDKQETQLIKKEYEKEKLQKKSKPSVESNQKWKPNKKPSFFSKSKKLSFNPKTNVSEVLTLKEYNKKQLLKGPDENVSEIDSSFEEYSSNVEEEDLKNGGSRKLRKKNKSRSRKRKSYK